MKGLGHGGSQTVAGASVSLYAAGTSGYRSAASQIAASTSGKIGTSRFPPVTPAHPKPARCIWWRPEAASETTTRIEPRPDGARKLQQSSATSVIVNEATTIASVYATVPFANNVVSMGTAAISTWHEQRESYRPGECVCRDEQSGRYFHRPGAVPDSRRQRDGPYAETILWLTF